MKAGQHRAAAQLAALLLLAELPCCSPKHYPTPELGRVLAPPAEGVEEGAIGAVLKRRIELPGTVRTGVVWIDDRYEGWAVPIAESDRTRLLEAFTQGLDRPPFGSPTLIPSAAVQSSGKEANLTDLRAAAARFQSDLLVVLQSRTNEYADWNVAAITFLGVIPALFMPGYDLSAYSAAEACAVHVVTGIFLGCVPGHGSARRPFVIGPRREAIFRELAAGAIADALAEIPDKLASVVRLRLQASGAELGGAKQEGARPAASRTPAGP